MVFPSCRAGSNGSPLYIHTMLVFTDGFQMIFKYTTTCIVIYLKLLIIYVHQFQKYICMLISPVCEKLFKYLESMASNSPLAENHTNRCTYTKNIVIEPFTYCLTHYHLYRYLLVQCPELYTTK